MPPVASPVRNARGGKRSELSTGSDTAKATDSEGKKRQKVTVSQRTTESDINPWDSPSDFDLDSSTETAFRGSTIAFKKASPVQTSRTATNAQRHGQSVVSAAPPATSAVLQTGALQESTAS